MSWKKNTNQQHLREPYHSNHTGIMDTHPQQIQNKLHAREIQLTRVVKILSISSDSGTSDWATRISENRNERDLVSGDTEETASTISCNIAIGDKYNLNIPPWQEVRRKENIFTHTTNESISDFDPYNKIINAQKYPNEHYLDSHVNNKATNFEYETNEKKITKTALTCCHMH